MSRLILEGNIQRNTGLFLPAPYINNISLLGSNSGDNEYVVEANVVVENKLDTIVYENGAIVTDEQGQKDSLNNVFFYLMLFHVNKEKAESLNDDDDVYNKRLPVKYYDQIINGEINPFEFYALTGSTISSTTNNDGQSPYLILMTPFNPFVEGDNTSTTLLYDEGGREFFSYNVSGLIPLNDGDSRMTWEEVGDLKVVAFSSTYDYGSNVGSIAEDELSNPTFFDMKISDISYEEVYNNGTQIPSLKNVYFDFNDIYYPETPILSIDLTPYKIDRVSQNNVIANIDTLLNEYKTQYETEVGFRQLKIMMDNIYTVLQTMKDSPGILVALNEVAKSFPDKTPLKPVGKLYRRFRNRIFTLNTEIRNSERLRRKLVYDSKIVDNRNVATRQGEYESLFVDSEDVGIERYKSADNENLFQEFVYKDWVASAYASDQMYSDNTDIVFGTFFFDYEKALRRTSNVSKVFDVDKLERWGIPIPYRKFNLSFAKVEREETLGSELSNTQIMCSFPTGSSYPYSDFTYANSETKVPYEVPSRIFSEPVQASSSLGIDLSQQPYYATPDFGPIPDSYKRTFYQLENGMATSLTLRHYADISNFSNGYGLEQSNIENYRLMCFQLLEYRYLSIDSLSYDAYVYIEDRTVDIVNELVDTARQALDSIKEYASYVEELCAYNEDTQRFNDFFIDGILEVYGDDPSGWPWITSVLVYLMHEDLMYNNYNGDLDDIKKAAKALSLRLNPIFGNPTSIAQFISDFESLIEDNYDGRFGTTIASMMEVRDIVYTEPLNNIQ